ncbi:endonuclease/exonuclease/phosphatase family protein [Brevibacillus sp. SAFN-007a]|uniref:endonuclease/exonuclease/phosphatase family protein n=1 Tax=Brevibacillus sp. SAFN-007a TaxID=3436862 RepID=UPI003F7CF307
MLRAISYNIHSGRDLWWRKRLPQMADTLSAWKPDIVGLQEVHQNAKYGYQASFLAEQLGYHLAFAPSIPLGNGHYGNALLSRYPLESVQTVALPAKREQRTLLQATFRWGGKSISVWVTHCSLNQTSRTAQLQFLSALLSRHRAAPVLLMGDFNATDVSFAPVLQDCAVVCGQEKKHTLPAFRRRLDYIFASSHWDIQQYAVLPVTWSDHVPIIVDARLK